MDTWFWGQWDYLWAWDETGRRLGVQYESTLDAQLTAHCTIMRSCGWWYPFADVCIVTDRPEIIARDERGRLHSHEHAALRYRDGYSLYASQGVRIEPWVIEAPEQITVARIDAENNAEVRRVMIERYCAGHEVAGAGAYLRDSSAQRLDHDENFGTLWRREVPGDEPIVMVEVVNRSPEPDGHFRHYMLRVPPNMTTAHEAVAWTFGRTPQTYRPMVET